MILMRSVFIVAVVATGIVAPAHADVFETNTYAQLNEVEGKVLVNRGESFIEVSEATTLEAGFRIALGADGYARVSYEGGCTQSLSSRTMIVVDEASCVESLGADGIPYTGDIRLAAVDDGLILPRGDDGLILPQGDDDEGLILPQDGDETAVIPPSGGGGGTLLLIGGGIGGLGLLVALAAGGGGGNNSNPPSPPPPVSP